ncbi:MAG: trigger factor [Patescibacteria group bacterium]|nr:trigger factor [Patescibacteria group bacterium]
MTKKKTQNKTKIDNSAKKTQQKQQQPKEAAYISENSTIKITIPWSKVKPIYQQTLKKQAKKLKIDGFRKGKVPLHIAEKKLNQESLFQATLRKLLPEYYQQAIKKQKKKPLTAPEFQGISINKNNNWEIKAYFAEKPEIELRNYKKVVKKAKKQADDLIKKAEKEEADLQKKKEKDSKAKKKISTKKSEKKDKNPQKKTDLSAAQKKDITMQTIFQKLIGAIEPKIPELLVKQQTEKELRNLEQKLKQLKIDIKDYLKSQNLTQQQLVSRLAFSSLNQLQVEFLLEKIAQENNIKAKQKEIDKKIESIGDKKVQELMRKGDHYQNYLRSIIVKQKVIDYLLQV